MEMKKVLLSVVAGLALAGCAVTSPSTVPRMGQAKVNGVNFPYVEQGVGVPVVFVHGSMTDYRIWEAQRPAVAGRYRYIAYTQRYFGSEPWTDEGQNFSQKTHAADLAAFIRHLDAGPVHVVAWSYGGSVATLAAAQHSELFRSLSLHEPTIGSLIAGSPEGKAAVADFGKDVAQLRAIANSGDALRATKRFWEFVTRQPEGGFEKEPQALQQITLENVRSVPLTLNAPPQPIICDMVKAIRAPVLVTIGADTRPLWALAGPALKQCVPNGELASIPNSNHDAIVRNAPDFNRELLGFLARH
ncbi:alpha/beta fold hydrolase [Noviherbaspirillum galbum]|uniref:Alpha/beta hydrolase n=1 Tax=Noviherbaspirillum galbum TaxID=2709383 RepID=A0A6B3SLD3_9BURK|nr:alpha/beta hydrolase [Noviherbaspirillum galbum]NEX60185.1 alpha/beta hydrolase [Noviherbaspirillum galbum]